MAPNLSDNKPILIFIAVVLLAILGVLVYQATRPTPEERAADAISGVVEDIGNTIAGDRND